MNLLSWFFLVLTVICWGSSPVLEKHALEGVKPMDGLFVRSLGVFFIFLVFYVPTGRIKTLVNIPFKSAIFFLVSGTLAGFVGMYFYFRILKINPASKIVPLASVYPLVTAILGLVLLKEGFSWQRVLGTVLIILGVLLVK